MKEIFTFDDLCAIEPRIKFYEADSGKEIAVFWNIMCNEEDQIEYIEDSLWRRKFSGRDCSTQLVEPYNN